MTSRGRRSVIYSTTPTSGSQSIFRLLCAVLDRKGVEAGSLRTTRNPNITDVKPEGEFVMIRSVSNFDHPLYDERFLYIVNTRDPRDMLCNQYYWLTQHPVNYLSDPREIELATKKRQEMFDEGIDAFVLRTASSRPYKYAFELHDRLLNGADNVLVLSYAQLCCDYHPMVERILNYFQIEEPSRKALAAIKAESPEGISDNQKWIGNTWVGTDTMPGRYRSELKPKTIETLNRQWADTLDRLAQMEVPHLRHLYSHAD